MAQDKLSDANPAPVGDRLPESLASHLAIIARPGGLRILGVTGKRFLQGVEHRGEQQSFKIARSLFIFCDVFGECLRVRRASLGRERKWKRV
jgi:hypothetical protein